MKGAAYGSWAFVLALSAYIAYESVSDLMNRKAPEHSIPVRFWRVFR